MSGSNRNLRQSSGIPSPFRVPDGYFDHFADRVMANLPDKDVHQPAISPWWQRYRYVLATAACICGLVFGISVFVNKQKAETMMVSSAQTATSEVTFDEMTDYAMYDNGDIYASLCDY